MKKKELDKFIYEYYCTHPSITRLRNGGYVVSFGYFDRPRKYRCFDIRISVDGTWRAWTRLNDDNWRPVKAEYETWYLFIKDGDNSGIQHAKRLCSLMGAEFGAYVEPQF